MTISCRPLSAMIFAEQVMFSSVVLEEFSVTVFPFQPIFKAHSSIISASVLALKPYTLPPENIRTSFSGSAEVTAVYILSRE